MKNLLIALSLVFSVSLAAEAYLDAEHMTTKQYMLNAGYSSYMSSMAEVTTRDPYAPTDDIYPKRSPKKFMQLLWKKVDPVAFPDINDNFHDIKLNAGFSDLN